METEEKLQRMLWWEFLNNAELLKRARLEGLISTLAEEFSPGGGAAAAKQLLESPLLESLAFEPTRSLGDRS